LLLLLLLLLLIIDEIVGWVETVHGRLSELTGTVKKRHNWSQFYSNSVISVLGAVGRDGGIYDLLWSRDSDIYGQQIHDICTGTIFLSRGGTNKEADIRTSEITFGKTEATLLVSGSDSSIDAKRCRSALERVCQKMTSKDCSSVNCSGIFSASLYPSGSAASSMVVCGL
jgi:hypothetical protein